MKKWTAILMTALLLLTLAACANDPAQNPGEPETPDAADPNAPATPDPNAPATPDMPTVPDGGSTVTPEAEPLDETVVSELSALFEQINEGVEVRSLSTDGITTDMWSAYLFIEPIEGATAVSSQSMIGSIAHSAVLLRLPEGSDAQAVADDIEANANPSKWICVTAETVETAVRGNTILFLMTNPETAELMLSNFEGLTLA